MQAFLFECEVDTQHGLLLRLPPSVSPGRHRISVVIDPPESATPQEPMVPIAETDPPRTLLWARLAAIRAQAKADGTLPEPLSWDEVLDEMDRRRGERDD